MGDALPKLTKPQMARLVEIGASDGPIGTLAERKPQTTWALYSSGLIEYYRDRRGMNRVRLLLRGVRVLVGLPGDEFDRFRAMLEDPAHAS